jgi:Sulfite exporter TauE/SafE
MPSVSIQLWTPLRVLVSLTSVGAGALRVTALLLIYPRPPLVRIVGSDVAHAVPLTLCTGLGHWMMGSIDAPLLISLLVGSLPGVVLGSYLARRTPEKILRLILAATLLLTGSKLLSWNGTISSGDKWTHSGRSISLRRLAICEAQVGDTNNQPGSDHPAVGTTKAGRSVRFTEQNCESSIFLPFLSR